MAFRERLSDIGVMAGLAVQFGLMMLGIAFLAMPDDVASVSVLFVWCLLGTVYAGTMIAALWVSARQGGAFADLAPRRMQVSPPVRLVGLAASVAAGVIGVLSAVLVLLLRSDPALGWIVQGLGAWAMLLAWGLVHWGFAQWYFQTHYASAQAQFEFPGTQQPLLVDFVYEAFTIGTTFATSDVSILTRRMRWTVTVHAVTSFFFNGAIIVLALNTLLGQA